MAFYIFKDSFVFLEVGGGSVADRLIETVQETAMVHRKDANGLFSLSRFVEKREGPLKSTVYYAQNLV